MQVTIKDVAQETKLSISTISKYINGGAVLEKNRIKIENAIAKLGYSPNSMARSLRTSKSYMVGIITGVMDNPHISHVIDMTEKLLRVKGYSVSFVCLDDNSKHAKDHIQYMINRGIDGWIVFPFYGDKECLDIINDYNIPVIALEESYKNLNCDYVQVNCADGAYHIVEYLLSLNHRKIAIINGPQDQLTARERFRGYLRAIQDYNLMASEEYIVEGDFTYKSGYEGIHSLWQKTEKPTAVFVTNYNMAIGAISAIHELDIKIPEELSFVSFDDYELSKLVNPQLTTVMQPIEELAEKTTELLIKRMENDYTDFPQIIRLAPQYNYRKSAKFLHK